MCHYLLYLLDTRLLTIDEYIKVKQTLRQLLVHSIIDKSDYSLFERAVIYDVNKAKELS